MGLLDMILSSLMGLIDKVGYVGIIIAVGLEYACFPMPSEIILPFVGFIASQGSITLVGAIMAATVAGILGSLLCYYIGYFGGTSALNFIGDKIPSSRKSIHAAKSYFDKYSKMSILFARVLPIARTYISIPAGIAKMNVMTFIMYSSVGIVVWNTILISLGYFLGNNWKVVESIIKDYSLIVGVIFALVVILFIVYRKSRKKKAK
jgi:membrane protein DedA with SNARE-associated domain